MRIFAKLSLAAVALAALTTTASAAVNTSVQWLCPSDPFRNPPRSRPLKAGFEPWFPPSRGPCPEPCVLRTQLVFELCRSAARSHDAIVWPAPALSPWLRRGSGSALVSPATALAKEAREAFSFDDPLRRFAPNRKP